MQAYVMSAHLAILLVSTLPKVFWAEHTHRLVETQVEHTILILYVIVKLTCTCKLVQNKA